MKVNLPHLLLTIIPANLAVAGCPRDNLRLNEILFSPIEGASQFVEIRNIGEEEITLAGVTIVSGENAFTLPAELTETMSKDDLVLVHFDGKEATENDLSFETDHLVTLHASKKDFLGNPDGHCSLYRAAGVQSAELLLDFVAWGAAPGASAADAVGKGVWPNSATFVASSVEGSAKGHGWIPFELGMTIAKYDVSWLPTVVAQVTPGTANTTNVVSPQLQDPPNRVEQGSTPNAFFWSFQEGVIGFQLQLDTDPAFGAPLWDKTVVGNTYKHDETLDGDAIYYWRVRAKFSDELFSDWSATSAFAIGMIFPEEGDGKKAGKEEAGEKGGKPEKDAVEKDAHPVRGTVRDARTIPGGASQPALRDATVQLGTVAGGIFTQVATDMTDASGSFDLTAPGNGNYVLRVTLANYTFPDIPVAVAGAAVSDVMAEGMGASASLAVAPLAARKETNLLAVATNHAKTLMCEFENTKNRGWDAPHGQKKLDTDDLESMWCWAVGTTMMNRFYGGTITRDECILEIKKGYIYGKDCGASDTETTNVLKWAFGGKAVTYLRDAAKLNEAQIAASIDGNDPIMFSTPVHWMVISSYTWIGGHLWCDFLNTDNDGSVAKRRYSTHAFDSMFTVPAGSQADARKTDATVAKDTDKDGVYDFDEVRFGSDKAMKDSDEDRIEDKAEIRSWAFPRDKPKGGQVSGKKFVVADVDGDGKPAQTDKDTDDGGIEDGDEDLNFDGVLDMASDTKESDVFDRADDKVLDLAFVVDSTGSMGDDIAAVKSELNGILTRVAADFKNWRIAVVDYRDYPPEDSIPYRAVLPFSNDEAAIRAAVNSLSASGGGDGPESLFTGIVNTINAVGLVDGDGTGWRGRPGDGIKRAIVYMTDAPAQNPEPVTGFTGANVIAALNGGGIRFGVPSAKSKAIRSGKILTSTGDRSGPISVYPIVIGSDSTADSDAETLVSGASGEVIRVRGASEVASAILAALDDISISPDAILVVTDSEGGTTELIGKQNLVGDLSRSFDPDRCGIISYEWDWEGDGTYDETTVVPVVSHDYGETGFGGNLRARITTFSGATAVANLTLSAGGLLSIDTIGDITLNPQTGLYEQTVVISNPGSSTIDALRLSISSLPEGVEIRGGILSGNNVDYNEDILPGASVTFVLEYYDPNRSTFTPTITAEVTTKTTVINPTGNGLAILGMTGLADGSRIIEFASKVGSSYHVQYSEDMTNWRTVFPVIVAAGSKTQWIDNGPPKTECHPKDCDARFYRILEVSNGF